MSSSLMLRGSSQTLGPHHHHRNRIPVTQIKPSNLKLIPNQFRNRKPVVRAVHLDTNAWKATKFVASELPKLVSSHTSVVYVPFSVHVIAVAAVAWAVVPVLLRSISPFYYYDVGLLRALEEPLVFLVTVSYFLTRCIPLVTAAQSQFVATARTHAVVLSLVWFIHKLKNLIVSNYLRTMELNRASSNDIDRISVISFFGSLYLYGLAFCQLLGMTFEYVMLNPFLIGLPFLLTSGETIGALQRAWIKQRSEPSSLVD